jgi:hypothetical protein
MYIKVIGDTAHPYTARKLREDNPTVSFPRQLTAEVVAPYGVFTCKTRSVSFDPLVQTQVDAGYVKEGDQWFLLKVAVNLPDDLAKDSIRNHREELMKSTDWQALSDNTMSEAMIVYRQALRDVTAQEGFPFDVVWPDKPC